MQSNDRSQETCIIQRPTLQCRNILEATEALPIIGDGDTGFGNALSVKRTVHGFANAGFAGILMEDQVGPGSQGYSSSVHSLHTMPCPDMQRH